MEIMSCINSSLKIIIYFILFWDNNVNQAVLELIKSHLPLPVLKIVYHHIQHGSVFDRKKLFTFKIPKFCAVIPTEIVGHWFGLSNSLSMWWYLHKLQTSPYIYLSILHANIKDFSLFYFILFFWESISLYSQGWPWTCQ